MDWPHKGVCQGADRSGGPTVQTCRGRPCRGAWRVQRPRPVLPRTARLCRSPWPTPVNDHGGLLTRLPLLAYPCSPLLTDSPLAGRGIGPGNVRVWLGGTTSHVFQFLVDPPRLSTSARPTLWPCPSGLRPTLRAFSFSLDSPAGGV